MPEEFNLCIDVKYTAKMMIGEDECFVVKPAVGAEKYLTLDIGHRDAADKAKADEVKFKFVCEKRGHESWIKEVL